jgi:hypothetical protein
MKTKRLLCPQRLRTVPQQFSWIGRRLVRESHIARPGKTHLATALGHAACQHGYSATAILFATAIDAINTLSAAQAHGARSKPNSNAISRLH